MSEPQVIIFINGDVTVVANPGNAQWDGGVYPSDNDPSLNVYAWDKDPSVTFTNINQTVEVDPRSYSEDTAGAQAAADAFGAQVTALQGSGFKGAFRYWKPDGFGSEAFLDGNWWETMEPYDNITVSSTYADWWDDFNARVTSNGVTPDFLILDEEVGISYFDLPSESVRESFFTPVTEKNGPYPNVPNPYIGEEIWDYNNKYTDTFIQEWNQDAADKLDAYIDNITDGCPVVTVDGQRNVCNYNDYLQSYEVGNLRNLPERLPAAQVRMSDISSNPCYLDFNTLETLTDPEVNYTSTRQQINRRRWKKMIWRLNQQRSASTAGSRVVPWIAPPGYGYNGADTWCPSAWLPFEKLLWRVKMRHLRALGVSDIILWNPDTNPNAADTDTFMDAYFGTATARSDVQMEVPATGIASDTITTNDRSTSYDNLYRLQNVYTQRAASPIEPFVQGFGTLEEPLMINTGATGDAELAAFLAALELVYGTEDGDLDVYEEPLTSEISGPVPAPE